MMDRSSRFISLSGLSGVGAGLCALVGAWVANRVISQETDFSARTQDGYEGAEIMREVSATAHPGSTLLFIAFMTFIGAVLLAFLFTWLRSRKTGVGLTGPIPWRLTVAVGVPIFIGFLFLLKLMSMGAVALIAPSCLLFYGLGLVNGSRYTTDEIRYLGYAVLFTGLVNLFYTGYGIYFWAFGFGVLHIFYGLMMWNKYERGK